MEFSSERTGAAGAAAAARGSLVARAAGILGFVGLITLGAHMRIGGPIPLTLQTFFVLLAGALLGPLDGVVAVLVYLAAGACAVPMFANANAAAGLSYFAGPTGGYLVGFIAAALLAGFAARRTSSLAILAAAFFAGALVILVFGVLHLILLLGRAPGEAFSIGFVPFVPGDILKTVFVLFAYRKLRPSPRPE